MATVTVEIADLAALGELICTLDDRTTPPSIDDIDACHDLIIKMMGKQASRHYASESVFMESAGALND